MPSIDNVRFNADGVGSVTFDTSTSNGTNLVLANSVTTGLSAVNLGNGVGIFSGISITPTVSTLFSFKSLAAGSGIQLSDLGNTVLVTATGEVAPPYFVNLADGPGHIVNAILIGNTISNTIQWSSVPSVSNTVLSWNGNSISWVVPALLSPLIATGDNSIKVVSTATANGQTLSITLSNTVSPGTYISPTIAISAQGRIIAISNSAIVPITAFNLRGDGNIITSNTLPVTDLANATLALSNTGVTVGTYTFPIIAVSPQGRITAIISTPSPLTQFAITGNADISVSGSPISGNVGLALVPTTVTAGTYIAATVVIDHNGRITNASNSNVVTLVSATVDSNLTLSCSPITSRGTLNFGMAITSVTAGTYSYATITVDAYGRLQNAISGVNPVTAFKGIQSNTTNVVSIYAGMSNSTQYFSALSASSNISLTISNTNVIAGQNINSGVINVDLTNTGIIPGTYNTLIVDSKGRATAGGLFQFGDVVMTGDVTSTGIDFSPSAYVGGTYTPPTINATLEPYLKDAFGNYILGPATFTQVTVDSKGRVMTGTFFSNTVNTIIAALSNTTTNLSVEITSAIANVNANVISNVTSLLLDIGIVNSNIISNAATLNTDLNNVNANLNANVATLTTDINTVNSNVISTSISLSATFNSALNDVQANFAANVISLIGDISTVNSNTINNNNNINLVQSNVTADMASLTGTINLVQSNVTADVTMLLGDISTVSSNTNNNNNNINLVQSNVTVNVASLTSRINLVQSNVTADMTMLLGNIAAINTNVNLVQSNVTSNVATLTSAINRVQSNVTADVTMLLGNIATVNTNLVSNVSILQNEINATNSNVASNQSAISLLQANLGNTATSASLSINLVQSNVTSNVATLTSAINLVQANVTSNVATLLTDLGNYLPLSGGSLTGPLTINDSISGDVASLAIYAINDTNGANIRLHGNGSTTPSKYIRIINGIFEIVNDAYSQSIFSLTDNGNLLALGGIDATAIGANTPSTAVFTTLSVNAVAKAPTVSSTDNSTNIATTSFVKAQNYTVTPLVMSGDVSGTASGNTINLTLGTVNSNIGSFGSTTQVPIITVNAKGLLTAVVNTSIAFPVTSVAGRTGAITLAVSDVSGAAPLASPALTGVPTAPTASLGTNNTQLATTAFVQQTTAAGNYLPLSGGTMTGLAVFNSGAMINGSGQSLRIYDPTQGTDAKYSDIEQSGGSVTFRLVNDAYSAANPFLAVTRSGITPTTLTITAATVSIVGSLASPALTGVPTAPTASVGTNNTQIATTAFVQQTTAAGNYLPLSGGTMTGLAVFSSSAMISGSAQSLRIYDPTQGTNAKYSDIEQSGGTVSFRLVNDAYSAASPYLAVARSGTTATTFTITAATVSIIGNTQMTGTATSTTPATSDNSNNVATTAFVKAQNYVTAATSPVTSVAGRTGAITLAVSDVSGAAPLASPALTGVPTAPTASVGTNNTQVATTAFVEAAVASGGSYNPNNVAILGGSINNTTIGAITPSTGAFIAPLVITSTSDTGALVISASGNGNGANLKLIGNGSTTPNKFIRVYNGSLQILPSAYSSPILTLDDNGNMVLPGTITGRLVSAGTVGNGTGSVDLTPGDGSHTGYIEFFNGSGNRLGYIGYAQNNNFIELGIDSGSVGYNCGGQLEVGGSTSLNGSLSVSGSTSLNNSLSVSGTTNLSGQVTIPNASASNSPVALGQLYSPYGASTQQVFSAGQMNQTVTVGFNVHTNGYYYVVASKNVSFKDSAGSLTYLYVTPGNGSQQYVAGDSTEETTSHMGSGYCQAGYLTATYQEDFPMSGSASNFTSNAVSYLTFDPVTNLVTGVGYSPDGTVPPTISAGTLTFNTIIATAAQVANASGSMVANSVIIPGTFVPPLASQAQIALRGGLIVTSNSTSSLNGTYPVDGTTQSHIQSEIISIMLSGAFADGTNTVAWTDTSGVSHNFSVAQFQALALTIGSYVSSLYKVINDVRDFHIAFEQRVADAPGLPSNDERNLRRNLLAEEIQELGDAEYDNDLIEVADALCDILYIVLGTCVSYGLGGFGDYPQASWGETPRLPSGEKRSLRTSCLTAINKAHKDYVKAEEANDLDGIRKSLEELTNAVFSCSHIYAIPLRSIFDEVHLSNMKKLVDGYINVFALPGFDPKTMTDDELVSRATELMRKMNWSARFATAGQGIDQMSQMLRLIEDERRERLYMEHWKMVADYVAEPIETDPDLRDAGKAEREKLKPIEVVKPRPRVQAIRRSFPVPTAHPVVPMPSPVPKIDESDTNHE
ncbi:unnamed protein product [Sphagnum tenellum]